MKQPHPHLQCQAFPKDPEWSIPSMPHSFSNVPSQQRQNHPSSELLNLDINDKRIISATQDTGRS